MATGPGFPYSNNTFIPNFEASGRLKVEFSRNPSSFPLQRWIRYRPTSRSIGYYLKITPEEAARVVSANDYVWPRGTTRPSGAGGNESFNFLPFATQRYNNSFMLDRDSVRQAEFDIVGVHSRIHAAKAMTLRTLRMVSLALDADQYAASNKGTATAVGGGKWDVGTEAAPYIKKALNAGAIAINKATLGVVQESDLILVVNPNDAKLMAESSEIHQYISRSPFAMQEIREQLSPNSKYGLPSKLYGHDVVVEDTVRVTSRKGDALAQSYMFTATNALMVYRSRDGEVGGMVGAPTDSEGRASLDFSSHTMFLYEDMNVESFDDAENRLIRSHVVDDSDEVVTSPASAFLFTAITG